MFLAGSGHQASGEVKENHEVQEVRAPSTRLPSLQRGPSQWDIWQTHV